MLRKLNKNNIIINNQLRSKLLYKNQYNVVSIKSSRLTFNFNKLKSFNDDIVLEGLFLLEFLGSLKGTISYYKKMYQEVNLQVTSILRGNYLSYFLLLLKIFYFPLLIRRNVLPTESFDKLSNYSFTLLNVNSFTFLPDIYFR